MMQEEEAARALGDGFGRDEQIRSFG